jgi:hypothetical protein
MLLNYFAKEIPAFNGVRDGIGCKIFLRCFRNGLPARGLMRKQQRPTPWYRLQFVRDHIPS